MADEVINYSGDDKAKISRLNIGEYSNDYAFGVYQKLKELEIATPSGFAGHHLSEWIKKEIEMDNKKGNEILLAMIVGLNDLIVKNTK